MISDVTQIVGAVSVVASLLILSWQTRKLTHQTEISNTIGRSQAHYNSIERLQEAHKIVAEYPELRPYIYEAKPCPATDPNRNRALIVAEMLADAIDYGLRIMHQFPDRHHPPAWAPTADFYAKAPIFLEMCSINSAWFPDLATYLRQTGALARGVTADEPDSRSAARNGRSPD